MAGITDSDRALALVRIAELRTPNGKGQLVSHRERWEARCAIFERLLDAGGAKKAMLWAWSHDLVTEGRAALRWARVWANEKRRGILVLCGGVGTSKTIAAARFALSVEAAWLHAGRLGSMTHKGWDTMHKGLRRSRALVIDDMGGTGSTSPFAAERLLELVLERHSADLATVITTNLPDHAFLRLYEGFPPEDDGGPKYDELLRRSRLYDRIREDGVWNTVNEPSMRGKGRKQGAAPGTRPNLYDDAKRLLALTIYAESGTASRAQLDELGQGMGVTDERIAEELSRPERPFDLNKMLAGITDKAADTLVRSGLKAVTCSDAVSEESTDRYGMGADVGLAHDIEATASPTNDLLPGAQPKETTTC